MSSWANGLSIHMARKHETMEQLDGNDDTTEVIEDKNYETLNYWKTGKLGTIFQTFLDVNDVIDASSNLSQKNKDDEKARALQARKEAFGEEFCWNPPWRTC